MQRNSFLFDLSMVLAGALITWIIFHYNPDKPDILPPDTSKLDAKFDSLQGLYNRRGDTIATMKAKEDSLNKELKNNHKKVANGKAQIDSFTPDSRARWNDSTLKRAGFRKVVPDVP